MGGLPPEDWDTCSAVEASSEGPRSCGLYLIILPSSLPDLAQEVRRVGRESLNGAIVTKLLTVS